jgi:hypothetical protein
MEKLTDAEVAARVHAYPRLAVCWPCANEYGGQGDDGQQCTAWVGECCLCGETTNVSSTRNRRWPQKFALQALDERDELRAEAK